MKLLDFLFKKGETVKKASVNHPVHSIPKYSYEWFKSLSDTALSAEREKVRLEYVSAQTIDKADKLYNLLAKFDKEQSKRAWGENPEYGFPKHREHGWYLSKDD